MPAEPKFIPLQFHEYTKDEMLLRSRAFHAEMERRRAEIYNRVSS